MSDLINPGKKALSEALGLSDEILRNLELNESSLENIALKTGRLARLLNDFEMQKIIQYEVSGYPYFASGLPPEIYQLAVKAGREFEQVNTETKTTYKYIFSTSISALETQIDTGKIALSTAMDPSVSTTSKFNPAGNSIERMRLKDEINNAAGKLSSRKSFLHHYALTKNHELKFSGIADDIFTRIRNQVDSNIGATLPDAINRLNAVYDNLQSDNTENWSNAVHSCRRILQDLADAVFPATDTPRQKNGKEIALGKDNYINRIICFVEDRSESDRFIHLVGSHLKFLGERLDAIFQAAQKGSHDNILTRTEADRYVVYTYLVVGDILTLLEGK